MINRINKHFACAPDPPEPPASYHIIETRTEAIAVPAAEAQRVRKALDRFWKPRWVTFRDITGAEHVLRATAIHLISASSPATRAATREFNRALAREHERDEDAPSW